MARVEGVDEVTAQRFAMAEIDGDDEGIAAASPRALAGVFELEAVEGSVDRLADGEVLLDEQYAADEGLAVGDTIEPRLNGRRTELEVAGVYAENPVILFPIVTTTQTLLDAGFPDADNALLIDATDRVGLQADLEEVVADLPIVTVKDQAGFAAEQREPIDQMVMMIFALLGLALLIAVLGIVNTLALSVIERTHEVGLLRAIGLSRPQLRRMITLESVVISVLGATLGVVMGIGFGVALMYALREEGLEVISVPGDQLGVFLVAALVVGVLAAVVPARRAARLDVLRAIGTE
jgi:putative ABC transport system permease protein